ncbi:MAG TPA: SDR family oxidoreductase [Gammaproteobacteria bacterium]|nr:3-oxoacyl-[acyl-carrier-protein] reductase FabG [bacterium BMS3Abin11]GBE31342.1 3-oxoacyl-[acyl-carrier-protein] reductase FabG [bacterium BMS3Bbin05]HDH17286.1 SDR family oxidoreductase [Gammaproteobacteria bacterium]HDZ78564.1 SDR family oxidoreductase [Gammaproteobacteria bacterium]
MLSNKRAVITGGSAGIGFGIANAFAQNGASIFLVARDERKLEKSASTLSSLGVDVKFLSADLSDSQAVNKTAEDILNIWPGIDVLVNNAGIARFSPFIETNEADLDLHLNLNVKAPYILTQLLFGALADRKGAVINISSYFSHRMLPGRPSTAYSLTKGAIDAFTKALAFEAGPHGIRVNAIAPGTVNTPLVQANVNRLTEEGKTKFAEMIKTIYPLGRIGEPDDVSGAAVFLASDQARWITGAILAVDGGLTTN